MTPLDKALQHLRIKQAKRFIKAGSVVLDIGSDTGELFKKTAKIKYGFGIDPNIEKDIITPTFQIVKGTFPDYYPTSIKFDSITLLAVLEHIPESELENFVSACHKILEKDGTIIITVPSPQVDVILNLLKKLRLIDGMELEQHYGFDVSKTKEFFSLPQFKLVCNERFQFGLNNLFVFQKIG